MSRVKIPYRWIIIILVVVVLLLTLEMPVEKTLITEIYTPADDAQQYIITGMDGDDAYSFSDSYTYVFNSTLLNESGALSISFWIKPEANFLWTALLAGGTDQEHYFQLSSSGNPDGEDTGLVFSLKNGDAVQRILSDSDATIKTNCYNYIVITFSGNLLTVYLNGVVVGSGFLDDSIRDVIENGDLTIGKSLFFDDPAASGSFENLTIYNKALDDTEVAAKYDELYPYVVLDSIDLGDTSDIVADVTLPEVDDASISWTSDHEELISSSGTYTASEETDDVMVTLTANLYYQGIDYQKSFTLWVLGDNENTWLLRSEQYLLNTLGYIFNDQQSLPDHIDEYDAEVNWAVTSGAATINNNVLYKDTVNDKEPVTLTASITSGTLTADIDISGVILDECVAYVMSYFNGAYEQETGKLAYSYDGLHWTALNNGEAIITSDLGSQRIRDPYIGRDANGNFVILATQGWDNPEIYVWRTDDLSNIGDASLLKVAYPDVYLNLTGDRAWAPEFSYDAVNDQYIIYYSDPRGTYESGTIYYVCTSDFMTTSYVNAFFETENPIIDATITVLDGKYWMFYKDNQASTIFIASASSITGGNWEIFDDEFIYNKRYIEGPFVVNTIEGSHYLYVDCFKDSSFSVAVFSDLGDDNDITWLDSNDYSLPDDDVRHGSVIAVTQDELDQLLEAYGD